MAYPLSNRVFALPIVAWLFSLSVSALLLFEGTNTYIPTWLSILSKLSAISSFILVAGYQAVLFKRDPAIRKVASLVCAALIFSLFGDLVNLNLSESYYRHGEYIKHDYLVDSIWFFMPAYVCFSIATCIGLIQLGVSQLKLISYLLIAAVFGLLSYLTLFNSQAGSYIIMLTSVYSVVIALPLALAYGIYRWLDEPNKVLKFIITSGLVLATVADTVIAQFWLFAKDSNDFYPAVREWNWILYCTSQVCLSSLPLFTMTCFTKQIGSRKVLKH